MDLQPLFENNQFKQKGEVHSTTMVQVQRRVLMHALLESWEMPGPSLLLGGWCGRTQTGCKQVVDLYFASVAEVKWHAGEEKPGAGVWPISRWQVTNQSTQGPPWQDPLDGVKEQPVWLRFSNMRRDWLVVQNYCIVRCAVRWGDPSVLQGHHIILTWECNSRDIQQLSLARS